MDYTLQLKIPSCFLTVCFLISKTLNYWTALEVGILMVFAVRLQYLKTNVGKDLFLVKYIVIKSPRQFILTMQNNDGIKVLKNG
ncbi:MAG: hypothetical protein LUD77_01865, partial [Clostridiales bacterium]|nr:hypothetical protein [Clostridiales bacterium]